MKPEQQHADARESIAYAELLKLAHDEGLKSIATELVLQPSEENGRLAIVKAAVESERGHYEGLGDADPGSVDDFLVPHLIRVAETRAKARALRDAVNCGVVSSEELDGVSLDRSSRPGPGAPAPQSSRSARNGTTTTRPREKWFAPPAKQRQRLARADDRRPASVPVPPHVGAGIPQGRGRGSTQGALEVSALNEITKSAAMQMIDQLLQTSAPGNGGGNGTGSRLQH